MMKKRLFVVHSFRKLNIRGKKSFSLFIFFLIAATSYSQIRLPKLISDGMVLQRDAKIKIWGWADKGEKA